MTEFLTAALPPVGGRFRPAPDDFAVEELPLYPACGEGEHLYVTLEKAGLTTFDAIRQLARSLGLKEREIGYAGLKDAHARTRQTLSFPARVAGRLPAVNLPGLRLLEPTRHRNKLRLGHLAGNRFVLRLHDARPGDDARARRILELLARRGLPNLFGPQRYGLFGNSAAIGRALLRREEAQAVLLLVGEPGRIEDPAWREGAARFARGDYSGALAVLPQRLRNERRLAASLARGRTPGQALRELPRPFLRLLLSAAQAELFDRLVKARLTTLDQLEDGDRAIKHANLASFLVTDARAEQPRADRFEISPSAPLFGFETVLAEGEPGHREAALLAAEGLTLAAFRLGDGLDLPGERRPLRVPVGEPRADQQGETLTVSFTLPRGSYATSVVRELLHTGPDLPVQNEETPDAAD